MFFIETKTLFLTHPFGLSRGSRDRVHNLFIQFNDGFGEGAPIYYHGQTVTEMERLAREILPSFFVNGKSIHDIISEWMDQYPNQSSLLQAMDLAWHDDQAKKTKQPLYQYLNLPKPEKKISSFTIGLDTKEVMLEKLKQADDYPILKIKVGGSEDLDILHTLWNHSHKPFYVDANEGWTLQQALEYLPKLEGMGAQLVEQPFARNDQRSYQELHRQNSTSLPIIIDEGVQGPEDVPQWAGIADGINIKLAKCGGIHRAMQVIAEAKKHQLKIMLGCMIESSLGITAAAHLTSQVDFIDLDGAALLAQDPFDGMKLIHGEIHLPDRIGIGAVRSDESWMSH